MDEKPETKPMGQLIQIDEARIRDHLGEMVRGTVEEALNAMPSPSIAASARVCARFTLAMSACHLGRLPRLLAA
jgi:hypothetical protein